MFQQDTVVSVLADDHAVTRGGSGRTAQHPRRREIAHGGADLDWSAVALTARRRAGLPD
ncbi:hypothetical protein [Kitasatospora sp. McL0602]|uniref:hypothetical protein n=1 Tax=Kitasatospora sp. McL0602 TaxID=3439530 RepID=UPI003F8C2752